MYRSILIPLDGSPFAEQALPWGVAIARQAKSRLDLIRVHVLYAFKDPTAAWAPYNPVLETESKLDEQLYLDATTAMVSSIGRVEVTSALVHGLTADGVLERVHAINADLIVMASHGFGAVGRFFLGSVADELIRRGAAPILLVPRSGAPPKLIPAPDVRRIIIPLDGSALAEDALGPAADLALAMETRRCTLLRIEPSDSSLDVQKEAQAYLTGLAGRLRERGFDTDCHVATAARPAEAILSAARGEPGILIAMATHGRGGATRLLFGSVTDHVARAASVPVLVCHPPRRR